MARILAFILLTLGMPLHAGAYDTVGVPMETWVRHASDTYDTFNEDKVGHYPDYIPHPCTSEHYNGSKCYRGGSSAPPGGVPRHCGFGPEYQDGHHNLYGNQEDNQCSGPDDNMMHAGFDYDDPQHSHQQENCGGTCPRHGTNGDKEKVLAAASGWVVAKVNNGSGDGGFGNTIRLEHVCAEDCDYETGVHQETIGTFYTQYSHCSQFASGLDIGDWVSKGDFLCYVGGTAYGQSNVWLEHLHFEVKFYNGLFSNCPQTWGYVNTDLHTMEECGYYDPDRFIGRVKVFNDEEEAANHCSQCGGFGGEDPNNLCGNLTGERCTNYLNAPCGRAGYTINECVAIFSTTFD